jgi:hypothetical protein
MKKLFLSLVIALSAITATAQVTCPPNIDFELGNYSYWEFFTGGTHPVLSATIATSPIPGRHTLMPGMSALFVDSCCSFPVVPPGGGAYTLKLGSRATGAQAEKARYYVHVPASSTNYSLIYRYALVQQVDLIGHTLSQHPTFEVNAFDSATGVAIPCGTRVYMLTAATGLPGTFDTLTGFGSVGTPLRCKKWSTESINLSGYAGQTIGIDFTNGDCPLGGHYGYAYIDMGCGLFAISNLSACDTTMSWLAAPPGFQTYMWYDSLTFTYIDSGMAITVPNPTTPTTYAVVLQPYAGFGCADTLYTTLYPTASSSTYVSAASSSVPVACVTTPIALTCTGFPPFFSFQWQSSPDNSSWADIAGATNAIHTFTGITTTTYYRCKAYCASSSTFYSPSTMVTYNPCPVAFAGAVENDERASIYPTPARDILVLQTQEALFNSFVIGNTIGQTIIHEKINATSSNIDIRMLPPGMYYITLHGEAGNKVLKFVKE